MGIAAKKRLMFMLTVQVNQKVTQLLQLLHGAGPPTLSGGGSGEVREGECEEWVATALISDRVADSLWAPLREGGVGPGK